MEFDSMDVYACKIYIYDCNCDYSENEGPKLILTKI